MPETATGATRYDEIVMIFSSGRRPDGRPLRSPTAAAIYPVRAGSVAPWTRDLPYRPGRARSGRP
jgi:hypothetical protein